MRHGSRLKGFTLIEVLAVLGVLAVLAGLMLPAMARSKTTSSALVCWNNLKQWGLSTQMYAMDYQDRLPPEGFANPTENHTNTGWYIQLPEILKMPRYHEMEWRTNAAAPLGRSIWHCPNNKRRSNGRNLFHYALNRYADGSGSRDQTKYLSSIKRPDTVVWMFDSKNLPAIGGWTFVHPELHSGGGHFLFLDGHVSRFATADYWDAKKEQGRTNNPSLVWRP